MRRIPRIRLTFLVLCLVTAGLAIASPSGVGAQSTICSGDIYPDSDSAKSNFANDCGQPFERTTQYRCDWVPGGWQCKGPGNATSAPTPTAENPKPSNDGLAPANITRLESDIKDRVVIEWERVSGAAKYNLYRNGEYRTTIKDTGGNQRFHDPGVVNGTSYTYRILAESADGSRHSRIESVPITYLEPSRPRVFEELIFWKANGRHSVRDVATSRLVCAGGSTCEVFTPGWYRVTNHASNKSTFVAIKEQAFVTVDHVTRNGEIQTVFNTKYGSFVFTDENDLAPRSRKGQAMDTIWLNHDPQNYDTPEEETGLWGGQAFEYEKKPDGTLGALVSVSYNGERITPEEWEVRNERARGVTTLIVGSAPLGKAVTLIQKAFKLFQKIVKELGGGGDDSGGDDGPPLEVNGEKNNWGWGNHPQGEFAGTPTTSTPVDNNPGGDGPKQEPNGPGNNWGWGDRPCGEFC